MSRAFYDLDVQTTVSSGDDTAAAMADRATTLGFDGIAVTDYVADQDDLDAVVAAVKQAREQTDIAVRPGAKLRPADDGDLMDLLDLVRDHVDVVVVHGGDAAVNTAACRDTRVDILAHPAYGRKDPGVDHVTVKAAADNRVAIGLAMRPLLETSGKQRAHVLNHTREQIRLCGELGARTVCISSATAISELRAPRELAAFPRLFGMNVEESFATVAKTPQRILDRADERRDGDFIRPGVERVSEEGDSG